MNTKILPVLIKRNTKLFFSDKGLFLTSLITPLILLLLYVTFLSNVYRDAFLSTLPEGFDISERLIRGMVGGQLISSILAVSCVTVAFCSNMLMVQDKANGVRRDFTISPIKGYAMSLSYYISSLLSTLIICYVAMAACLIYIACIGWYLSFADVLLLGLDVLLMTLFGTALSSVCNVFLSTQGQISAVGSVVSSTYGFISGAYMPISQFSQGLQNIIGCLPGTYGTSLVRNHAMRGTIDAMAEAGVPAQALDALRDAVDCNIYFFGTSVPIGGMYGVLCGATAVLLIAYVLITVRQNRRAGG